MADTSASINTVIKISDMIMVNNEVFLLLVGVFVAAAAANLGMFMVLKRMSLVGDALSHVALPGIAIAMTFNISPMIGAFVALFFAIIGIWYLSQKSAVYPEALVGVIFTGSLALGMLITPEPELLEALFGDIEKITPIEGIIAIILSLIVIVVTKLISRKLILSIVSEDLARSTGIRANLVNLIYLLSIGVVVALGVKFVGTLLTGALVIVPAAAAKNVSSRLATYSLLATAIGIVSAAGGIIAGGGLHIAVGPCVVLLSIFIFILSYFFRNSTKIVE